MTHFQKWIQLAIQNGYTEYEASQMPEAKAAAERDEQEYQHKLENSTKQDFIAAFTVNRKQSGEGDPSGGFLDQDEMLQAMSDPLYDKSEAYREAVAEILNRTSFEVVGVQGHAKYDDGSRAEFGRQEGKATVESMMRNAWEEAVREKFANLDLKTAEGRFQYMTFLQDPANQEIVAQMESALMTPSDRMHQSMLADQADGHIDRIQLQDEPTGPWNPNDPDQRGLPE